MSDDIVTRLRNMTILVHGFIDTTINEAADEIEQLRRDCDTWHQIANRLGTHLREGLYDDDWECREYAISSLAEWERMRDA